MINIVSQIVFAVITALILSANTLSIGKQYFTEKEKPILKIIFFAIAYTAAIFVSERNFFAGSLLRQIILTLFPVLQFKGGKWEKIGLFAILAAAVEFIANAVSAVLSLSDIALSNILQYERGNTEIFSFISWIAASVIAKIIFSKTDLSEGSFIRDGEKILFVSSFLLLILTDIYGYGITKGVTMVYRGAEYGNTLYDEIFTHIEVMVLALLCLFICMALLFGINRIIGYVMSNSIYETEIVHYKSMTEQYKNQVNVRHDMKNHLICMSALAKDGEYDKLQGYLSKIIDEGLTDRYIETGNSVIDSVINVKKQLARKKSISFECDLNISKPVTADEYDLCVIIGNILDNAINSAELSDEEKYIKVRAEIVKNNLIFDVKNSVHKGDLPVDFDIKYYGTGLRNISKILERQNGIMDIETSENIFDISVMLPLKA